MISNLSSTYCRWEWGGRMAVGCWLSLPLSCLWGGKNGRNDGGELECGTPSMEFGV